MKKPRCTPLLDSGRSVISKGRTEAEKPAEPVVKPLFRTHTVYTWETGQQGHVPAVKPARPKR